MQVATTPKIERRPRRPGLGRSSSKVLRVAVIALVGLGSMPRAAFAADDHAPPPGSHSAEAHTATGDAHGAGAPAPINWFHWDSSSDRPPLGFVIVNFTVLIAFLVWAARRPLTLYLQAKHDGVRSQLDEAARLRREAQERLEEIEEKLGTIDDQIAAIQADAARQAEAENERILSAAKVESQRIIDTAKKTMQREIEHARRKLETAAISAGIEAAQALVGQSMTEADRRRLFDEYLAAIDAASEGRN